MLALRGTLQGRPLKPSLAVSDFTVKGSTGTVADESRTTLVTQLE
jgi:hypothetical protein